MPSGPPTLWLVGVLAPLQFLLAKVGQIFLAKVGLAKVGFGQSGWPSGVFVIALEGHVNSLVGHGIFSLYPVDYLGS